MTGKKVLGKKITEQLQKKPLFQLLRDGLKVNSQHSLDLLYFKPERSDNKHQEELAKKTSLALSVSIILQAPPMHAKRKTTAKALI